MRLDEVSRAKGGSCSCSDGARAIHVNLAQPVDL